MSTQKNTTTRVRDERGSSLISVQMGVALGAIIIGAFMAFMVSANASAARTIESSDQFTSTSLAARHVAGRVRDADSVLEVSARRLVFSTYAEQGWTRTYYEITDAGEMVTATVPVERDAIYTVGEAFVPSKTLVRNLDPMASWFEGTNGADGLTFASDTRLVDIVLDGKGAQITTAASVG